jgi:hypothetical protein
MLFIASSTSAIFTIFCDLKSSRHETQLTRKCESMVAGVVYSILDNS